MLLIIILAGAFIVLPRVIDIATRAVAGLTDRPTGDNVNDAVPYDRNGRIAQLRARHTRASEAGAVAAADQLEAEIREQERAS